MGAFLQKVGVSIASRLGITAGIALVAAALLGGGYWWMKSLAPRETVKAKETGVKLDVEPLCFYGDGDIKVDGTVYRPSETLDQPLPAIIYCQAKSYGESWCRPSREPAPSPTALISREMVKKPVSRNWKPS